MTSILFLAPPTITNEPTSRGIDILNNVTLPCTAVGKPKPTIIWKRADGREIDFSSGHFKVLPSGSLVING